MARATWVVPTMGVGAALPVGYATVRALADGWVPVTDQGIIATRAYDVLTWLPARLGAPASLTLTIAAVNVASIVGVVAIARRRGGGRRAARRAHAVLQADRGPGRPRRRVVPPGGAVWLSARGRAVIPVSPAIRFALRRRGVRVLGVHAERRVGSWYRLDHRRVDEVLALDVGHRSGRVVGRVTVSTAAGPQLLTATVSPGRSPRRPVRPRSRTRPTRRATHEGRRRP
jgi:hypothetical protein